MSDAELWAAWRTWMIVASVIILIAASLLISIWISARRILSDAGRALHAADAIRGQTQAIWELQTTNLVAEDILATVQAIEEKGNALAGALGHTEVRR